MPKLLIETAAGSARLVVLQGPHTTIGRAPINDVVIDDPKVSRCHAVVTLEAGFHVVRNLSSKNGLRVNGQFVHARLLRSGDGLTMGGCELQFIADEEGDEAPSHSQDPESTLLPA